MPRCLTDQSDFRPTTHTLLDYTVRFLFPRQYHSSTTVCGRTLDECKNTNLWSFYPALFPTLGVWACDVHDASLCYHHCQVLSHTLKEVIDKISHYLFAYFVKDKLLCLKIIIIIIIISLNALISLWCKFKDCFNNNFNIDTELRQI